MRILHAIDMLPSAGTRLTSVPADRGAATGTRAGGTCHRLHSPSGGAVDCAAGGHRHEPGRAARRVPSPISRGCATSPSTTATARAVTADPTRTGGGSPPSAPTMWAVGTMPMGQCFITVLSKERWHRHLMIAAAQGPVGDAFHALARPRELQPTDRDARRPVPLAGARWFRDRRSFERDSATGGARRDAGPCYPAGSGGHPCGWSGDRARLTRVAIGLGGHRHRQGCSSGSACWDAAASAGLRM